MDAGDDAPQGENHVAVTSVVAAGTKTANSTKTLDDAIVEWAAAASTSEKIGSGGIHAYARS
jgi:hypothetical protein